MSLFQNSFLNCEFGLFHNLNNYWLQLRTNGILVKSFLCKDETKAFFFNMPTVKYYFQLWLCLHLISIHCLCMCKCTSSVLPFFPQEQVRGILSRSRPGTQLVIGGMTENYSTSCAQELYCLVNMHFNTLTALCCTSMQMLQLCLYVLALPLVLVGQMASDTWQQVQYFLLQMHWWSLVFIYLCAVVT